MTSSQISKPVVFISHAHTDEPIASLLTAQMNTIFANGLEIFSTSRLGVVRPGNTWLDDIKINLNQAKAVVVLITPISINRPWIWFEVGASWSRREQGSTRIYPLCVPEIDLNSLPTPLNSLQALSLGKAPHVKLFFEELCKEFGFGNMRNFKPTSITQRLPKYSDLKVVEQDLEAGTVYQGPCSGYSDDELSEVLLEWVYEEGNKVESIANQSLTLYDALYRGLFSDGRTYVTGKLIHFRELDEKLQLPPNTSRRLLKFVLSNRQLVIRGYQEHLDLRLKITLDKSNCLRCLMEQSPTK